MWWAGRVKGETLVLPSHVSYSRITCVCLQGSAKSLELGLRVSLTLRLRSMDQVKKLPYKDFFSFLFWTKGGGRLIDKTKKERKYRKFCPELCFTLIYRNIHYIQPLSIIIVLISAYFWPVDDWKGKEKIQKPDNKEVAKEATHRSKGKKVLASSKIVSFSKKTFFLNAFH